MDTTPQASSLRFATAARVLANAARAEGIVGPAFRSPPRVTGADRTLRRRGDGGAHVAVRLRGRPWAAVLADMVDGVVAANQLTGSSAAATRAVMWSALDRAGLVPGEQSPVRSRPGLTVHHGGAAA